MSVACSPHQAREVRAAGGARQLLRHLGGTGGNREQECCGEDGEVLKGVWNRGTRAVFGSKRSGAHWSFT